MIQQVLIIIWFLWFGLSFAVVIGGLGCKDNTPESNAALYFTKKFGLIPCIISLIPMLIVIFVINITN